MADLRPNNLNGLSAAEREKVLADMITNPSPKVSAPSMQNPLGMFPQPNQVQGQAVPVQSNPNARIPQKSNLDQLKDLFASTDENLGNEEALLTKLKGDIERFEKGDGRMDLTPLAAFADTFTGSKISSMVTKPLTKQEREATAIKLNSDLLERLQKVRGEKERRMDDVKLKLLGLDNQKEMTFAKLQENALYRESLEAAKKDKVDAKIAEKDEKRRIADIGYVNDERDAPKVRDAYSTYLKLSASLDGLKKLRSDKGAEVTDREAVSRGKSIARDAQLQLKTLAELGAITGPDLAILQDMIPDDPLQSDSGTWTFGIAGDPTTAKFDEVLNKSKKDFHSYMRSRGVGDEASRFKVTGLTDNLKTPEQEKEELLKQKGGK